MKTWLGELFKKYIIIYFPWMVIFTASLYPPADSDLGWHLKYGEYFFTHFSILRENIFSQMMQGYHWVNSSWAIDLFTYSIFRSSGFIGLSIVGAVVITATVYLFSSLFKTSFWTKAFLFPFILYLEAPLFEVSFRGQLLSLLFIGVLFKILSSFEKGKTITLYLLIPLFILWSNLHGEFLFGLALLGIWMFTYIAKLIYRNAHGEKIYVKKQIKLATLIFTGCFVGTLFNPFGIGIYQEAIKHFGNPLQQFIVEWIPFETFSLLWWKLIVWTMLFIISILILFYQKKISAHLEYIVVTAILCIMSYPVRRYMWPMLLTSLPVVYITFEAVKPKWKDLQYTIASIVIIAAYLYVILWKAPKESLLTMNWNRYCSNYVGCSQKSIEYIINQKPKGNLLTFYNWGGFMIWNYPQLKPTIDGRMHLWQDESGYSAFRQYYPIEQNWVDVDQTEYDIVLITPRKPLYKRLIELVKEGKWQLAYQDTNSGVFIRNNSSR